MKIERRRLAELERVYSICPLPGAGEGETPAFLAGSEGEGPLLLFRPPAFEPQVVAEQPGGFISVAAFERGGRTWAVASTRFYFGFNAADSTVVVYPLDEGFPAAAHEVATLPFLHRVAVREVGGRLCFFGSTLCAAKESREDWTQPGGIHLAEIPDDPTQPWATRRIVHGLNKNHGFDYGELGADKEPGYLLSALEGLFFLPLPAEPGGEWPVRQLRAEEHSDAWAFDMRGAGKADLFTISPFHGNVFAHMRQRDDGWEREVFAEDIPFGHIVWAGRLLGGPAILAGGREDRKALWLYRADGDWPMKYRRELIDEGSGPTQMTVIAKGERRATLIVAGRGSREVLIHELEA